MIITILQSIVLGIIQGATEFIPVSSSAHLVIVPWLFGWNDAVLTSLSFDVSLHIGTLLAVLIYFAKDWWRLLKAGVMSIIERKIGDDPDRRMAWLIVIGTIPGGLVGMLAEDFIDGLFHQSGSQIHTTAMVVMAVIIALWGLVLWLADEHGSRTEGLSGLTFKNAILIGLAQALAVFPGISRSGSTIAAGLFLGFKREAAARFSFYLSAPIIIGAGLKSVYEILKLQSSGMITSNEMLLFPAGMLAAAVSGFICIHWLLSYLQKNSVKPFVYYRWALALLVFVLAVFR